jgi:hypothetical protein
MLDATGPQRLAVSSPDEVVAYANASFVRCTVVGQVQVHGVPLAENSIFASPLRVLRRQAGCVRFCFVPTGSRTPQRFHCQPDLAVAAVDNADAAQTRLRVVPLFRSRRYGSPHYMRLADTCCEEIRSGASDESSMGVYHDLYEPQRQANLALRLEAYVPAGAAPGMFFAS